MRLSASFSGTLLKIIAVIRRGYFAPPGCCLERMIAHCRFLHFDDKSLLVNDIAQSFVRKIIRIRDNTDTDVDTVLGDPIVSDAKTLYEFKPLYEADILVLIRKSSEKKCNLDPMPIKIVVESIDHLLPVIAKMINSSLLG